MVVEPSQKNLLRREAEELFQGLILFQQAIQLRVQLYIDLSEKTTTNNLPDKTQDEMLTHFDNITRANIDDGTANTLARLNHDVVVLAHLKRVKVLGLLSRHIQDTLINGVRNTVIDELGEDQSILTIVKHFEGIGGERQAAANVCIACQDCIDVSSELCTFVFVNRVRDICAGALHLNLAADAALRGMAASSLGYDSARRSGWPDRHAFLGGGRVAKLCDELAMQC